MKKIIVITLSIVILIILFFIVFKNQQTTLREVLDENLDVIDYEEVIEKIVFKKNTTDGTMVTGIEKQDEINQILHNDIQLLKTNNPSNREEEYIMALHFNNEDYAHEYLISENYILLRDAFETHNMYEVIGDNYIYEYIQSNNFEWVFENEQ
ncbi:hypothetical protein [Virgibacillus kimchii]